MNEINASKIIEYLNQINPDPRAVLELSAMRIDVVNISNAISKMVDRVNANRPSNLLEQEITAMKQDIAALEVELNAAHEANAVYEQLKKEKAALLEEKHLIDNIEKEKAELGVIKDFLQKHNFNALALDLEALRTESNANLAELLIFLDNANQFFAQLETELAREISTSLDIVAQNRREIFTMVNGAAAEIHLQTIHLQTHFDSSREGLDVFLEKYNALASQINDIKAKLRKIKEEHGQNLKVFETHFSENQNIWGELGKRHQIDEHLNVIITTLESGLNRFDEEIKRLVEKGELLN